MRSILAASAAILVQYSVANAQPVKPGASTPATASAPAGVTPDSTDWPRWAGPKGDCSTDEKGLLKEWPKDGPKVLWRGPIGVGSNHPSVAGEDLCYTQLDADNQHETVMCVDANSGKERWHHTIKTPPLYAWNLGWGELGPRATATITDKYVYTIGTFGNGFCFDRKTGKIVWEHDFKEESPYLNGTVKGGGNLEWKGYNGSLIPIGDKIFYFYWQGGNPAIPAWAKCDVTDKMQFFAYDANTGKVAWKFEEACSKGCRGPGLITGGGLPIRFNKEDCLVVHGNREWKILRQSDGKQVWHWECCGPNDAPAWACGGQRPVGKNLYLDALNGWQTSLVECDFSQADPKPKALWTNGAIHGAITPPVILDGYVYGFYPPDRKQASEMGAKPGEVNFSLQCTELKTGKAMWTQPGFFYGLSMSAAEGLIYLRSHQTLTLVQATPKGYVEKGKVEKIHNLSNTGRMAGHKGLLDWNMPAISKGRLFIRTPLEMICYDIKDTNAK